MLPQERIDAIRADLARKSAYGIHPEAKTAALAPMSQAWQAAAFNLMEKALVRHLRGDDAAADRLVATAAALEFDEHEEEWPQLLAADQAVFNALADQVEVWKEYSWYLHDLAAARFDGDDVDSADDEEAPIPLEEGIVDAANGADPGAVATLRGSIEEILSEAWRWELDASQQSVLGAVAAGLHEGVRARDLPRETTDESRVAVIRAHLDLAKRLVEEFNTYLHRADDHLRPGTGLLSRSRCRPAARGGMRLKWTTEDAQVDRK